MSTGKQTDIDVFESTQDGKTIYVAKYGHYSACGMSKKMAVSNLKELLEPVNAVPIKVGTPVTVHSIKQRRILIRHAVWDEDDPEVGASEEYRLWRDVLRLIASGDCENPQEYARQAVKTANWPFRRG